MSALYNAVENSGELVITKFDSDYRVEARYVVSTQGCDCPAGSRPTCRHRKMREIFLRDHHVGDEWFLDWDTRLWWKPASGDIADAVVERSLADTAEIDDANPLKKFVKDLPEVISFDDPALMHKKIAEAVGEPTELRQDPSGPDPLPAAAPTAAAGDPPSSARVEALSPPLAGGIRRRIGT